MGLQERRAVKKFEEETYPALKEKINAAAGYDVPMEVHWDTLGTEGYAHLYEESFGKVFFVPIAKAFQAVCVDDMGKEALRDGLKKVIVRHTDEREISFDKGTLTFDQDPVSNLDDVNERALKAQAALEKGL